MDGIEEKVTIPTYVESISGEILDVACGLDHTIALTSKGVSDIPC